MKSNKFKILLSLGALLFVAALIWFAGVKKTQITGSMKYLKIDEIEDKKGLGYSGQRKVAVFDSNNVFVTYRKKFKGESQIFVAKITKENRQDLISGTDKPIAVVDGGADQRVPSILIDSKKVVHVVWYGSDSDKEINNRQIKYSFSKDAGKTWSDWRNISVVEGYNEEEYWQEHPYIFEYSKNILFIAWEGKDKLNSKQQIKISKSLDGGATWSTWKNVRETPDYTQSRPTIVRDKQNRMHLFAYSSNKNDGDKQQIVHAWSDDAGGSWSEWDVVSDPDYDSRHVSATVDPSGKIALVWRAQNSLQHSQIMYRSSFNGHWSEIQPVYLSQNFQFFPSIGADNDGSMYAVWMESEDESKLPTEDPSSGVIYSAQIVSDKIKKPELVSEGSDNLYPNMPELFGKGRPFILYESKTFSSDKFSLRLIINK